MANYKLSSDYWETSGIYDIGQGKTQREINAEVASSTGKNDPSIVEKTATGAIATFDGTEGVPLKNLTVNIEPVQSGSGDPSPDNIRPITGWTGCEITHTGKNLIGAENCEVSSGKWFIWGGTSSSDPKADGSFVLTAGTYTISANASIAAFVEDSNGNQLLGAQSSRSVTFTISQTQPLKISLANKNGTTGISFDYELQLEAGSTATEYEPFGTIYPISFPLDAGTSGTVYGGTLTWNQESGWVLTVTDKSYTVTESSSLEFLNSGQSTSTGKYWCTFYMEVSDLEKPKVSGGLFSHGKFQMDAYDGISRAYVHTNGRIFFVMEIPSVFNGNTQLRQWYSNTFLPDNPLQVVSKLATSVSYTLSNSDVITLLGGTNNIWADTGDVDVEYGAYFTVVENQLGEKIPKVAVAPIEKTTTASKAYDVNEMFFMGDKLYIATAPIASGATFTVGTNCDETTLGEQITALLNA